MPPAEWKAKRNELRHALVGLGDRLKECTDLVNTSSSAGQALGAASRARGEVEAALREVDAESV